jgi:hypothetical protein
MNHEWLSTWPPIADPLETDKEGLQQLLRACGCNSFEDMYDQVMNSTPTSPPDVGPAEVQAESASPGRVEPENPASDGQQFRENPADDTSSVGDSSATLDSDFDDLLNFEPDNSPHHIGDIDMDELIAMYGFDESTGTDDDTTMSGGDDASESDACAYPTPATTASTVTGLGPVNFGR